LTSNNIHIIPSKEIDAIKWDEKIRNEKNGLIYSTSSYLNLITDAWDGLIVNDYQTIVAIPHRKKGIIEYCYSPPFMQQLGIIGKYSKEEGINIINTIKQKYKYGSLQFNFLNKIFPTEGNFTEKKNFLIDLNKPFREIENNFRKDLKLTLEKCKLIPFKYINNIDFETAIQLYQAYYGNRLNHVKSKDYQNLIHYCQVDREKTGSCFTRSVVNDNNEILAVAVLLKDEKRLYNIANSVSPIGRELHANHYLIYNIIKEFAEQALYFDFEGSVIPGVKEFYKAFGPEEETYFTHQFNNLPFPLSLFA
jgi:hypothetical protein